jgi:exonuclease III
LRAWFLLVLAALACACTSFDTQRLRLATWNVEYLITPATFAELKDRCVPDGGRVQGEQRSIPCGIVPRLDRDSEDFAALARYARQLDADVLALQEVDGPAAAQLFLQGYHYCFTTRPNVQKNGFAIRRGIPFVCEPEFEDLSLADRLRRGVVVTLFPGSPRAMTLMSVHLKSGCPAGPMNNTANTDCVTLTQQLAPLEAWIDAQAAAGKRFGLLGDFNRRIALETGPARDPSGAQLNMWTEINDGDPQGAKLTAITQDAPFRKCVANDPYDAYIDLVILGEKLTRAIVQDGFVRVTYEMADAAKFALSDHCPVGVDLRLR